MSRSLDPTDDIVAPKHSAQADDRSRSRHHDLLRAGYLLKDRVADVAVLTDAIRRICEGECVVDPTIISRLMGRVRHGGPLSELTGEEFDLLGLIAEGHSDGAIGERLRIDPVAVGEAARALFRKLGVRGGTDELRRIVYALEALRSSA